MRKSKNLIILIVVLGILTGSYFFLSNRPEPEEPDVVDKVSVLKLNKDDIVKMEIENEFGGLTFNKVEKEVEEEKDGKKEKVKKSVWEVDYPYEVTLREIRVDDLAYSFANLEADVNRYGYACRTIRQHAKRLRAVSGLTSYLIPCTNH
jgi:uncharacterized protein YpuA (DUF1002 family)